MKINYKKVATIVGSALMIGATAGMAAAASLPSSFTNDLAIVVGSTGVAAASDNAAALSITNGLLTGLASSGSVTVTGGDSVKLERTADKFNLGDVATSVFVTNIDERHMPTLLAKGSYRDADNDDFSYTQKVELGGWSVAPFRDTSFSENPEVGIRLNSGDAVLNYTLSFTKQPTFTSAKMENTNLHLFGKEYFVLDIDNSTNSISLLDSATTTTMGGGETKTVSVNGQSYTIEVITVGSSSVRLSVNGEQTNALSQGQTYKLTDGTFVGIKDLVVANRESDTHFIEVSVGSGKLVLTNGNEVELNDETVYGLTAHVSNSSTKLTGVTLQWKVDEKQFITSNKELVMPGFGNLKVAMTGITYPNEEETKVSNDGDSIKLTAPIKSGTANLNLLYVNSTSGDILGIGESADKQLVTSAASSFLYNYTAGHRQFVASWNTSTESESYVLSATVSTSSEQNRTTIRNEITGQSICSDLINGDSCSVGNINLVVSGINRTGDNRWVTITANPTTGVSFNTLYTAEGMKIYLPVNSGVANTTGKGDISFHGGGNETLGYNATSWFLWISEEDKDSKLANENSSYLTITSNSDKRLHVSNVGDAGTALRVGTSDKYEYHIISDLATRIAHDRSGNEYSAVIKYAGEQTTADVYVTSSDATTGTPTTGVMTVKDTELASVSGKNLIVVGGNCVNTLAAELLGTSTGFAGCLEAFEAKTGAKSGEAVIKSFPRSGKLALLVAGYNAADTTRAATYLVNNGLASVDGTATKLTVTNTVEPMVA